MAHWKGRHWRRIIIRFKQYHQRCAAFHSFFGTFHVSDAFLWSNLWVLMSFVSGLDISIYPEGSSRSLVSSAYLDDIATLEHVHTPNAQFSPCTKNTGTCQLSSHVWDPLGLTFCRSNLKVNQIQIWQIWSTVESWTLCPGHTILHSLQSLIPGRYSLHGCSSLFPFVNPTSDFLKGSKGQVVFLYSETLFHFSKEKNENKTLHQNRICDECPQVFSTSS